MTKLSKRLIELSDQGSVLRLVDRPAPADPMTLMTDLARDVIESHVPRSSQYNDHLEAVQAARAELQRQQTICAMPTKFAKIWSNTGVRQDEIALRLREAPTSAHVAKGSLDLLTRKHN